MMKKVNIKPDKWDYLKDYHWTEAVMIMTNLGRERRLCPACVEAGHQFIQQEAGRSVGDCKNVFINHSGNSIGQCNCWCEKHYSG